MRRNYCTAKVDNNFLRVTRSDLVVNSEVGQFFSMSDESSFVTFLYIFINPVIGLVEVGASRVPINFYFGFFC